MCWVAGPRGAPRRSLVPARPATQSPGPPCTPGGTDSPGWVGGVPARYASPGWRPRPGFTPGWAQGRLCRGRGLGEPVLRGPGAVWKDPWVKSSFLPPGSSSPLHFGLPSYLLFGVRLSFCGRLWVRPGRRGLTAGARARGPQDPRTATQAPGRGLLLLQAQHPRAPFPIWTRGLRLIPPLAPLAQFRKLLASVPGRFFPGAEGGARREPWGAVQLPLPSPRPSVLCKSVWDAGAFGNPGPLAPCGRGGPLVGAGTSARLWPRLLFQVR